MPRIQSGKVEAVELFAGCTRGEPCAIARWCTEVDVGPKRTLCEEGEIGREFFVMSHGQVEVSRDTRPIATLDSGQWFGEVALTTRAARRIAEVTTTRPSTLLVFGRHEFASLLALCAKVGQTVLESSKVRTAVCSPSTTPISRDRLERAGERASPARIPPERVGDVWPDESRRDSTARFDRVLGQSLGAS
jgi:CRP-like cAMP-binding protein